MRHSKPVRLGNRTYRGRRKCLFIFGIHHIDKKMQISQPLTLDEIPEDEQEALLTKVATEIVRRRLTVPAILFLETCKPINFIGSQMLIALNPFVASIFNTAEYQKFALIIEKDANVELLTQLIEKLDGEEKK